MTAPYLKPCGTLVIPADSDPKYHHWAGGQSVSMTLIELMADEKVWARYSAWPYMDCPEFHAGEES